LQLQAGDLLRLDDQVQRPGPARCDLKTHGHGRAFRRDGGIVLVGEDAGLPAKAEEQVDIQRVARRFGRLVDTHEQEGRAVDGQRRRGDHQRPADGLLDRCHIDRQLFFLLLILPLVPVDLLRLAGGFHRDVQGFLKRRQIVWRRQIIFWRRQIIFWRQAFFRRRARLHEVLLQRLLIVGGDGLRRLKAGLGQRVRAVVLHLHVLAGDQPAERLAEGAIAEAQGGDDFGIERGVGILPGQIADDVQRAGGKGCQFIG